MRKYTCKKCGRQIAKLGGVVCDAECVTYWKSKRRANAIMTPNGLRINCEFTGELQKAHGIGYPIHKCLPDIGSIVLQVHHFESEAEDTYIKVVMGEQGTHAQQVIDAFENALRATNDESIHDGCRFTWLNKAMDELRKVYRAVDYCEKQQECAVFDLDFCRYLPTEACSHGR